MRHPFLRHRARVLSALAAAALLSTSLRAQTTIRTTLGPGESFDTGTSYAIGADAPGLNLNRELATSFTYAGPSGFELFDLGLALRNALPGTSALYTIRFTQGSDFETSSELQSWSFGTSLTSPTITLQRFDFGAGIALVSGATYWVHVAGNVFLESVGGWALSSPVVPSTAGQLLRRSDDAPDWADWDSPLPAYDVRATGTPVTVPEPALASLLLVAVAPLAWRARRRAQI